MREENYNNEVGIRIQQKMRELRISQEDLAGLVGTSQNTISKIVRGAVRNSSFLPDIAEALGVSELWLRYGDLTGNAEAVKTQTKAWDKNTVIPDGMIAVPYFKDMTLSAGHGALNSDMQHSGATLWFSKSFLRRQGACPEKVFCITVAGDSMEPRYEEGGIVIIDTTLPINVIDGKAYAIHYEGEDFIKYLRRLPGNQLLITSENKIYEPFKMDADEVKIIGRVIGYQRED